MVNRWAIYEPSQRKKKPKRNIAPVLQFNKRLLVDAVDQVLRIICLELTSLQNCAGMI
jgi:hypothetical protein